MIETIILTLIIPFLYNYILFVWGKNKEISDKGFKNRNEFKKAISLGYPDSHSYKTAMKFRIPSSLLYNESIVHIIKYGYPNFEIYEKYHDRLILSGFNSFNEFLCSIVPAHTIKDNWEII